jgi:hypothetical protein
MATRKSSQHGSRSSSKPVLEDSPRVLTVAQFYRALEDDISRMRSGEMSVEIAKAVWHCRSLQLRRFELEFKAQKIARSAQERCAPAARGRLPV